MATLTETAYKVRQGLKIGGLLFVAISVLWFTGGAAWRYYQQIFPPAAAPPTMDFGALPPIQFPKETGRPKLELELPTGAIPAFPDRLFVYYAPTRRSNFTDPQRAIDTASALGFIFKPEQPSEVRYVWRKQDSMSSVMEMDIVSGHFKLTRDWQNNPALLAVSNFISDKQVAVDVANFLNKAQIMPNDLGKTYKVTYLKSEGSRLVQALSLSDAQLVQIDMFRNDLQFFKPEDEEKSNRQPIAQYSFYTPDPDVGLIRAVVSSSNNQEEKIINMDFNYTKVEYDTKGEYPIKTGEQAWQELLAGKGFVTDKSPKKGTVKIRRIQLGYFDTNISHKYIMPVYVFLGDQNFAAFVSAVDDGAINHPTPTPTASAKPASK